MASVADYRNRCKEYAEFVDTMLALFKGELTYNDIMSMPYFKLVDLRTARIDRLNREQKAMEKDAEARQKQQIRDTIMSAR